MYVGLIWQDGREVAVKRVLTDVYKQVKKEVEILVKLRTDNNNIVDYMVTSRIFCNT